MSRLQKNSELLLGQFNVDAERFFPHGGDLYSGSLDDLVVVKQNPQLERFGAREARLGIKAFRARYPFLVGQILPIPILRCVVGGTRWHEAVCRDLPKAERFNQALP